MTPAAVLGSSLYLIEILHQTTTKAKLPKYRPTLYLIEILHQTTTLNPSVLFAIELYLIEILHQTTTLATVSPFLLRCILSKFYIKPQLYRHLLSPDSVVSYRNSTSNHNRGRLCCFGTLCCILSKFYIKPQRLPPCLFAMRRCILSKFYIKPQPAET